MPTICSLTSSLLLIQNEKQSLTVAVVPKKHHGRPSIYLTEEEIKECMQYYSTSNYERAILLKKYGKRKIKHAFAICRLDMGRKGVIFNVTCPVT